MLINVHRNGRLESKNLTLVSHRGGKGFGPENTLESLAGALEFGVEMVETDVRMSSDGVPFICHSPFLGLHLLTHMTMSEIREKAPDIPTLEEYLNLAGDACSLNLEIKRCEPAVLAEAISRASLAHPILVSSFDADFLKEFRRTGGGEVLGLLTQYELAVERQIGEAARCGATTLLPVSHEVNVNLVSAAHDAALGVITWTVNSASQLESMIEADVDGVITDCYRELKEFLEAGALEKKAEGISLLGDSSSLL
jgi:glycerophosphoryl diester phosphodiesterase